MADAIKPYTINELALEIEDWKAAKARAVSLEREARVEQGKLKEIQDKLDKAEEEVFRREKKIKHMIKDIS